MHFQVLGKVWLLWGKDFGKVFALWWTRDVKKHWRSGEWAHHSMNVLPLASAKEAGILLAKVSNLRGTDTQDQFPNLLVIPASPRYTVTIPGLFLLCFLVIVVRQHCTWQGYRTKGCVKWLLQTNKECCQLETTENKNEKGQSTGSSLNVSSWMPDRFF